MNNIYPTKTCYGPDRQTWAFAEFDKYAYLSNKPEFFNHNRQNFRITGRTTLNDINCHGCSFGHHPIYLDGRSSLVDISDKFSQKIYVEGRLEKQ